jgi:NADPH-dependent 7-cyano-7-deazaguanine reductase QueF
MDVKERLFLRIRQACPMAIGFDWKTMRIDFDPAATVEQRASAQAILDSFDPVQEQAAIEAEEVDERDIQDWQRTKARAIAREIVRHVKALEAVVKVKFPNVPLPDWTIED